ncbi:MAG: hypothetical protein ACYS5V_02930 [Planctomycetota bacterium]|jgi:hypothetical protein
MSTDAAHQARQAFLDDLAALDLDPDIGPAVKWAFAMLWHAAGAKPDKLCISAAWLGQVAGRRSPRAARKWIDKLVAHGLLEILDTDRRGVMTCYVYRPNPPATMPPAAPDPQARLPFPERSAAPAADVTTSKGPDLCAPKGPTPKPPETPTQTAAAAPAADVTTSKGPPRPIDTKEQENLLPAIPQGQTKESLTNEGPFAGAVAAALDRFGRATTPTAQKARLKDRIRQTVGPDLDDWAAGAAADLVVFHEVPQHDLDEILAEIAAGRRQGRVRNAPGLFNHKCRRLAGRRGKPWTKAQRQAARDAANQPVPS